MKIKMSFEELGKFLFTPTLCPECPIGQVLYFLVDGKCHHCGCKVSDIDDTNDYACDGD